MFNEIRKFLTRSIISRKLESLSSGGDTLGSEAETSLILSAYRQRLMAAPMSGGNRENVKPGKKRYANDRSRKLLKAVRKGKRPRYSKDALLYSRFSESTFLSRIKPDRNKTWIPILRRRPSARYENIQLEKFSFIDNPQYTLLKIQEILDFECRAIDAQLDFCDPYCLDVSPYLVLAEMWPQMVKVFRGGRMDQPVQKVIDAIGLRRDLMMQLNGLEEKRLDENKDIWAFPKRARRPAGSSRDASRNLQPQPREKVADEFCEMVDDWFQQATEELVLTKIGKARFANIFGELLDNAERHSHDSTGDGSWSTASFMARRSEDGADVYRCHMGFLSVGNTIAEGLQTAPQTIRDQINHYCDLHSNSGISRDTLSTLVALQDGVTRDSNAEAHGRGGVGLQEVLELINIIGVTNRAGKEPRMTIVSGSSCIQARFPYLRGRRNESDDRRFLWFNEENSPEKAPDKEYVFDLSCTFPGTIIGLTFILSKDDLLAVLDADNQS